MVLDPQPVYAAVDTLVTQAAAQQAAAVSLATAAQKAVDQAEIDRLNKIIKQLENPAVPPPFGVNAAPGQESAYTDLLDPKVLRYYFQVNEVPVWPLPADTVGGKKVPAWTVGPDRVVVTSHKKIDLTVAQLLTYYQQLPTDRITRDCGWHEPGKELRGGVFTKAAYNALYARMRQAQAQVGDHIQITPILEGIAFLGGNNPADELPDDPGTYDVIGVDPYFSGNIGQPIANLNPVLDTFVQTATALGKPWAVCETGVGGKLTGQARNDGLTALGQGLLARNVLFACYFLGKTMTATEWKLAVADGSRDAWLRGAGLLV